MVVEGIDKEVLEAATAAVPVPVEEEPTPETDVEEVTTRELAVLKKIG